MSSTEPTPISVNYRSAGGLLLYGDAEQVQRALPLLPDHLKVIAAICDSASAIRETARVQVVAATLIQVTGHLGRFRARAAGPDGSSLDLGPLSPSGSGLFDLVLDLGEQPLIDLEVPPIGYARTRGRSTRPVIEAKINALSRLVGTVNKPRYFSYDVGRCAHDRQGVQGCRACLDACPAGAISSDAGIKIDPYLCRGCGSCTQVCPTGAVRYARPRPRATFEQIAAALGEGSNGGSTTAPTAPVLLLHAGADETVAALSENVRALGIPALGAVGIELWLSGLALGASRVLLLKSGLLPATALRILEEQVALAQQLLRAIGLAPERIRLIDSLDGIDWEGLANPWPAAEQRDLGRMDDKRALLIGALKQLASGAGSASFPEVMPLPLGQGIGSLEIDAERCTFCRACLGLCPTGALRRPATGGLAFAASACVQCGLCVDACPEQALSRQPIFEQAAMLNQTERLLKPEPEPFHCVECGTAFLSQSLINGGIAQVRQHPMFQGDGLRLLQMCMSCRQKAALGLLGERSPQLSNKLTG